MGISLLRDLVGTKDDFTLLTALGDAINLRLIRKEDGERYAIHRLLAKVRRHENPLENRKEWHLEKIKRLKEWFYKRKNDFNKLLKFEAEIEHLKEWQKQSSKIAPSETTDLLALRAYPLWHRGNYQESKILLEDALSLYNEKQIDDGELLSNLYNDLGVISSNLGNHQKAFEYKQNALKINQDLPNGNLADSAKFLNNLGSTYGNLGNHQEALKLKQKALEMNQELFGEKHPNVASSLNNLGTTYDNLGNHKEALKHLNFALEIRRAFLTERHPHTILTCYNLISVLSKTGGIEKAIKLAREFLSYVPPNHPNRKFFEHHARTSRSSSRPRGRRR
ncbi:MAG TPA: tetratricopeptide repeat protein [Pyrinomonadaceae bacterium]|jgi:tetratricopeptide (TPR) repeat protein